jgi:hypothetical protein
VKREERGEGGKREGRREVNRRKKEERGKCKGRG